MGKFKEKPDGTFGGTIEDEPGVSPLDEHNATLLSLVAPEDWENPTPADGFVYDLIAVGAGAGGLVSAKQTARRGFKSALIEKHLAGGDCLNVGCVPSKALLRCARLAREARRAREFGICIDKERVQVDFGTVMERMRRLRAKIAPADSFTIATNFGVDVFRGQARFTGCNELEVDGKRVQFRKAVIASGARAALPSFLQGFRDGQDFFTNSTIFNLKNLPQHLVVLGGGAIGIELCQAFRAFGSMVTVVLRSNSILPKEDGDVSSLVMQVLEDEGIHFNRNTHVTGFVSEEDCKSLRFSDGSVLTCDALLVAIGRKPNTENLGLEIADVDFTHKDGVSINDRFETSNPNIFAVGDIVHSSMKFTHLSGTQAQLVVENAMFGGDCRNGDLLCPRVTFCEPEVATCGLTEKQASKSGLKFEIYKASLEHNDRAIIDGPDRGFAKIICAKDSDVILGATIVCENAGGLLPEISLAMQSKLGMTALVDNIRSYPTINEVIGACAFQFKTKKLWRKRLDDGKISEPVFRQILKQGNLRNGKAFSLPETATLMAVSAALAGFLVYFLRTSRM